MRQSAGLILYRCRQGLVEVFLVHPGGPFWAKKDLGAWSMPKGEFSPEEDALAAARREFQEETGFAVAGDFVAMTPIRQPSGKLIHAWVLEGDCDPGAIRSNTFSVEWPPRSGLQQAFPEVDRAEWFPMEVAKEKISKGQLGFLEELERILRYPAKSS